MGSITRKFKRRQGTSNEPRALNTREIQLAERVVMESIISCAALAAEVVQEEYGKLKNKENRPSNFMAFFLDKLGTIDNPTPFRKEFEAEMKKHIRV